MSPSFSLGTGLSITTKVRFGSGGAWSPVGKTGVVAAWDMETVYQEAALSTAVADTDPIGGVPDLTGNGNILSQTGAARPVRASGGGFPQIDFDGVNDWMRIILPTGQRTTNMIVMTSVKVEASQTDGCHLGDAGGSTQFQGLFLDTAATACNGFFGTPTSHVNNGPNITTRDALRDALATGNWCIWESRGLSLSTYNATITDFSLFSWRGTSYFSEMAMARGVVIDALTCSADDIASARAWLAGQVGVTL